MSPSRIALLVLAVLAAGYLIWLGLGTEEAAKPPPVASAPPPATPSPPVAETPAPAVKYPIEQVQTEEKPAEPPAPEPLPAVDESDGLVAKVLEAAVAAPLRSLLQASGFIRRVVATVDNLPREKAAVRLWPVAPAGSLPVVDAAGGGLVLSPQNEARYARYVQLAESVDLKFLIGGYKRLYPLFERAYKDLGYPEGHFNDRLVAVIDHLLAAPSVQPPIGLVQPKILYRFADPSLESLSAGQKIMVRMGPSNAERVKARLRAARAMLAGGKVAAR